MAAPTIASLTGSVNWPGTGTSVRLDVGSNATASDPDFTGGWTGATLTVQRAGGAWSSDNFGFMSGSNLSITAGALELSGVGAIGSITNANGVMSIMFNGLADATRVNTVLRSISYSNATPAGDADIRFTLSDGTGGSATADVTVNSNFIYVTNQVDTATIDLSDGVSFSEAMAIADAQPGINHTILLDTSLAGKTITLAGDLTIGENRTIDSRAAPGVKIEGHTINIATGQTFSVWSDGATIELASTLSGAGTLHVRPGTVILSSTGNEAAMSGTINVQGGALSISSDDNLSSGQVILNTARLNITADGVHIDNAMEMGVGMGNISVVGTNTAYLDGTISGGALNKEGGGTLVLTGTNTHSNTASAAGTLRVTSAANLGQSFTVIGDVELAGSGTYDLPLNLSGGAIIVPTGVSVVLPNTLTTFTGQGLTKDGAGTLTLANRTYAYSGATNVSGGMLVLSGSTLDGTAGLTVSSGATLAGSGTIFANGSTRTVTVNTGGTLSPGALNDGTTQLTINGNLMLSNGSTLDVDVKGTAVGTGYDQIRVLGTATVTSANFTGGLGQDYSPGALDSYTILNATAITGTFAGLPGGASSMFGARPYTAGYSGGFFTLTGPNNIGPTITSLNGDIAAWAGVGNTVLLDVGTAASAADPDAINWNNAVLTLRRAGGDNTSDQFGFDTDGAIFSVGPSTIYLTSNSTVLANYTNTGGVLTITFTADALTTHVTQVLRHLTYRNDAPFGDVQISIRLTDALHTFTSAAVTVAVGALDVIPTISARDADSSGGYSAGDTVTLVFSEKVATSGVTLANLTVSGGHGLGTGATLTASDASGGYAKTFVLTLGAGATLARNDTLSFAAANVASEFGQHPATAVVFTAPQPVAPPSAEPPEPPAPPTSPLTTGQIEAGFTGIVGFSPDSPKATQRYVTLSDGRTVENPVYASTVLLDDLVFRYSAGAISRAYLVDEIVNQAMPACPGVWPVKNW